MKFVLLIFFMNANSTFSSAEIERIEGFSKMEYCVEAGQDIISNLPKTINVTKSFKCVEVK